MSVVVAPGDALGGVAARGTVIHAEGEPKEHALAILLAAFAIGYGTPYLLATVVAGDANCTGCTTNTHKTRVTCNGGPCNGGTTQMDETSCNKCCTDDSPSECSHKDGTLTITPRPPIVIQLP